MIDRFTKERFEGVLPLHKETGVRLWKFIGFLEGEFVYGIDVFVKRIEKPWATIHIRSSVGQNGFAKETGKDSIRLYIMRDGRPHGSKLSCYITRVTGWEERLLKQLRIMYKRVKNLRPCEICGNPKAIFKKVKDGKLFQACPIHFNSTYENYEEHNERKET